MEQLCGSMAMMDNEGFIRVLGGFDGAGIRVLQIMITVPSDKDERVWKKRVKETQGRNIIGERDVMQECCTRWAFRHISKDIGI